ncbi:MAG: hypothetical protein CMQ21_15090 [Gammaproteobacteria bacterium]|jgi:hypothetical protein|nr:hypothetical protein [Gammaproteobacteria bacterium]|tara:strand:+ start:165 stop:857 length:693 start_codon:yes stop_codon:yes gene_type:complete
MKKFLKSFVLIFLLASTYVTAEPVMTLITVNTDDPAGYLEWARGSSETIGKTNNASAVGICSPRIGAEEMGDLYFWNLFDSNETAWKNDPNNPAIAKEVAKMKVDRTIRDWDNYRIVRQASALNEEFFSWNIMVKTSNMTQYLSTVDKLHAAMKENGFEDVNMQVFVPDSGRWSGGVMVAMQTTSAERLGAALDARTQPWFTSILAELSDIREYQYGWGLDCETLYSAPQ